MSTLRVSNIEAKADASSPTIDEKVKVTSSQGRVLVQIDGKNTGITSVGINTTGTTFTIDGNNNVQFVGVITAANVNTTGVTTFTRLSAGAGTSISSPATNVLVLGTNNVEAVRIDSSNNIGLGTNGPGRKLHLYGNQVEFLIEDPSNSINSNRLNLYISGDKANFRMLNQAGTGGTVFLQGDSSGNVTLPTAGSSILNSSGRKILNQTGSILQVVSVNKTDEYFLSGTGTPTDVPGLSVSITPSSTSSQILILGHVNFSATSAGGDSFARLMRGATAIGSGAGGYFGQIAGQDYYAVHSRVIYLVDSPATTSSTTYKIQVWGQSLYVNSRGLDGSFDTSSQIVLMEIAG